MKKNIEFHMSIPLTYTIEEYKEWVKSLGNEPEDVEHKTFAEDSLKDESLPCPVESIQFHYPYDTLQVVNIQPVSTKVALIQAVLKEMTDYIRNNPNYCAPHVIDDFVVEAIMVHPFVTNTSAAYVLLGS